MRKYISFLLVVSMLLSLMVFPAEAKTKGNKLIASLSFNDIVTGLTPSGDTVMAGGGARTVVTNDGKDKGLELAKSDVEGSIYMTAKPSGDYISVYADMKYTNGWSKTDFFIQDSANKQYILCTVGTNGAITLGNGKEVKTVPKGVNTSVQVTYDIPAKRVSVFVGGKSVVSNRYLTSAAFSDVAGMGIKALGDKKKSLVIDNFAIADGNKAMKSSDIPKAAYLDQTADLADEADETVSTEGEYEGEDIYI